MTEEQLQAQCYLWFHNEFPQHRGMLHHNDNNSYNRIIGARKKALGVVAGLSDMELICDYGIVLFIEMKIPGGVQSSEQKDFERKVVERGHIYVVIFNFEQFKNTIYGALGTGK